MKRLVTNVTLVFLCLAGSAETASIGIFGAFSVKYLQTQFGLSPGTSGMLVGRLKHVLIVDQPDPWKWSCWYHMGGGRKEGLIPRVPDTITYTKMYDGLSEGVA